MMRTKATTILLLASAVALAACEQQFSKTDREQNEGIARLQMSLQDAKTEIRDLRETIQVQQKALSANYNYIKSVDNGGESLRKVVNKNVAVTNANVAKDMTRRGACGTAWKQASDGRWFEINKDCTVADLR